jgi:hypothetical protein
MSLIKHKLAAATAVAAAFSLAAAPAAAAGLPRVAGQGQTWDAGALDVEGHGHHGGHHGGWGHDDDWDIDGDDVLAGVLILGGIAAISAIANSGRHREQSRPEPSYPESEPYRDDAGYQVPAPDNRYRAGGMAEAVDTCVAEVEAGRGPVGSVDRASRSGEGWYVAGELDGGAAYACWTDGAGRVTNIEAGDQGASYETPADDDTAYDTVRKQAVEGSSGDEDAYALAQAGE